MVSDWVTDALITKTVLTGALGIASLAAVILEHFPRLSPFTKKRSTHIPTYAQFTLVAVFLTAAYTVYNDWSSAWKEFASEQTDQQRFDTNVNRLDSLTQRLVVMDDAQKLKALADSQRFRENLLLLDAVSENLDSTSRDLSLNVKRAQQAVGETYDVLQQTQAAITELSYSIDRATIRISLKYANSSCIYHIDTLLKRIGPKYYVQIPGYTDRESYYLTYEHIQAIFKEKRPIYDSLLSHHVVLEVLNPENDLVLFSYMFGGPPDLLNIDVTSDTTYYWYRYSASLDMMSHTEVQKPTIGWFRRSEVRLGIDDFFYLKQPCPVGNKGSFSLCFKNGYCLSFDEGLPYTLPDSQNSLLSGRFVHRWFLPESIEPFIHYEGIHVRDGD